MLIKTISPKDNMFQGNYEHYFNVGESAIECIRLAIKLSRNQSIHNVLDLPCGYGRVLRTIKNEFPEAQITACDLEKDGVDFCADTFSAVGVYSDNDLSKINLNGKFDLIWCGSLITHIDMYHAQEFLDFFIKKLETNGILVVTVHGWNSFNLLERYGAIDVEKIRREYNACGYGYSDYKGFESYGISIMKPSWIMSYLEQSKNTRLLYYSERLWDEHQDVLAVQKVV